MEIITLRINNNSVDYFSFGKGEKAFVIIPGLSLKSVMKSADAVADAYKDFAEKFTVYVFDRAKNIKDGYSIENMADDTACAMQKLGISGACVFGASQGGMIAQILAAKYPQLVSKLLLGSTLCRMNSTATAVIGEWVSLAEKGDVVALNKNMFNKIYSKELLDSLGDNLMSLLADGTKEEVARLKILAQACLTFDSSAELSKIKCPAFVLSASNDRVLSTDSSKELAEMLDCPIHIFEGGHAVYDEAPDYKKVMLDFLS